MDWHTLINFGLLAAAAASAYHSYKNRKLAEKLSGGKMIPQVQIRPTKFLRAFPKPSHCATVVEITNYTNFPSFEVEFDVKYSGNNWIMGWSKAREKELEGKGQNRTLAENEELNERKRGSKPLPKLEPGDVIIRIINGSCPKDICDQARVGNEFPIYMKILWHSEKGQTFERTMKYGLLCTRVGEAEDFSFLNSELVSSQG